MDDLLRIVAVLVLIGANAFFVIGEFAVVTARRSALAAAAEGGSRRAVAALRLMDDPVRVISTVQVGITALGILTGAISEPLVRHLLGDAIPTWLAVVLAFTVVTYLSVLFGELVPKALTLDRAETLAALVARPIDLIARAAAPLVWVLERSAETILKPFGVSEIVAGEAVRTPEELRALVDEAEESGVIPRAQEELLHNVFDFAGREARDIMLPASDVVWLDASLDPDAALGEALKVPHGRYPVGDGDLDHVVGVALLVDLVAAARGAQPAETIRDLARPLHVVPETKDVGALLRELRERRQQMAVVVDEYGTTAGIVALEDVLEEIVGEIEDEFDLPDSTLRRVDDDTIEVAGSMTIDDFNEQCGTRLPLDRSARTLAGLVFDELGRGPHVGDAIALDGVTLRVLEMDGLRITRLAVSPVPNEP
jgi:putative hemolysin